MATSSTTVDVSSFTTDAKFRAWGSAISAALTAAGLTQTSDTGQINWTTVTKPTTTNTKAGYEIWRFNDSVQSTRPIYFRLDYGSNATTSGNCPTTWLTVGTGSDAAGTITGVGMTVTQASTAANAANSASSLVGAAYSSAAGAATIIGGLVVAPSTHGGLWAIARTCDSSGAPTGDGVVVYRHSIFTAAVTCASYSPAAQYTGRNVVSATLSPSASISTGSTVELARNYAAMPTLAPTLGAISYYTADIATNAVVAAAPFGSTSHNYLALGASSTGHDAVANSSMLGAYIWE